MAEHERGDKSAPIDITEQFVGLPAEDFLDFLRSTHDTILTIKIDIARKPLDFEALQKLMSESHIRSFTIQATPEDHDKNKSLFAIAGVDWEPKK